MRSLKNPRKRHVFHVLGKMAALPLGRQVRLGGMAQFGGQIAARRRRADRAILSRTPLGKRSKIISLAVVLGVASAAYAFTPSEAPQAEPVAPHHNHTHVHELNAEEGQQHNVSAVQWYCRYCGQQRVTNGETPPMRGCSQSNNHLWKRLQ